MYLSYSLKNKAPFKVLSDQCRQNKTLTWLFRPIITRMKNGTFVKRILMIKAQGDIEKQTVTKRREKLI